MAPSRVDLSDAQVVDDHCHAFRLPELLERAPQGFEARLTLMGMCAMSSARPHPAVWARAEELVDSTVYSLVARRWLAERLHCDPTAEAVTEARTAALRQRLPSACGRCAPALEVSSTERFAAAGTGTLGGMTVTLPIERAGHFIGRAIGGAQRPQRRPPRHPRPPPRPRTGSTT